MRWDLRFLLSASGAAALAVFGPPALADFTVRSGDTATTTQTLGDSETGTIESGGAINVTGLRVDAVSAVSKNRISNSGEITTSGVQGYANSCSRRERYRQLRVDQYTEEFRNRHWRRSGKLHRQFWNDHHKWGLCIWHCGCGELPSSTPATFTPLDRNPMGLRYPTAIFGCEHGYDHRLRVLLACCASASRQCIHEFRNPDLGTK